MYVRKYLMYGGVGVCANKYCFPLTGEESKPALLVNVFFFLRIYSRLFCY